MRDVSAGVEDPIGRHQVPRLPDDTAADTLQTVVHLLRRLADAEPCPVSTGQTSAHLHTEPCPVSTGQTSAHLHTEPCQVSTGQTSAHLHTEPCPVSTGQTSAHLHTEPCPVSTGQTSAHLHTEPCPVSTGQTSAHLHTEPCPVSTGPTSAHLHTEPCPVSKGQAVIRKQRATPSRNLRHFYKCTFASVSLPKHARSCIGTSGADMTVNDGLFIEMLSEVRNV